MISVVMPWVILLTTRPSPSRNASREWLWMSMNPGATTRPVAFTRSRRGGLAEEAPGHDRRDLPVQDTDVAVEPGGAGAVDDAAAFDDEVVAATWKASGWS